LADELNRVTVTFEEQDVVTEIVPDGAGRYRYVQVSSQDLAQRLDMKGLTDTSPSAATTPEDLAYLAEMDRAESQHLNFTQLDCPCPLCRAYAGAPDDERPR
jgi:hypothetical protein